MPHEGSVALTFILNAVSLKFTGSWLLSLTLAYIRHTIAVHVDNVSHRFKS